MDRRLQIWLIPFGVATSISVAKPREQVQVITAGIYAALRVLFGHQGTPAAGGGTRKSFFVRCFILLGLLPPSAISNFRLTPNNPVSWIPTKARRSQLWS